MEGFVAVPNSLLELVGQGELGATDALLLSVIVNLSKQTGYCWATNLSLGGMLGISNDRAKRKVAALVSGGFLESTVNQRAENSIRRQLKPTEKTRLLFGGLVENNLGGGAKVTWGLGCKRPGGQVENNPLKENIKEKENKTASGGGPYAPARSGGREAEPQSRFTLTTGEDGTPKYVMNS